jgi:hypothetical protein
MGRSTNIVSQTRHSRDCTICNSTHREEIEAQFVDWRSQSEIAREFGITRLAIWRHCRASHLFEKRDGNLRATLGNFIERCARVRPTGPSFVAAVVALSKLDSFGRSVDRVEQVGVAGLFARMTLGELTAYAETGELPPWATDTAIRSTEDVNA